MSSIDFNLSEVPPDRLEGVLANLQAEKTRRTIENKLAHYRPYPKQAAFHAAGSKHRERLLMAGNQLGKCFDSLKEAERQLYLAVIRGNVKARLKGRELGPEWLKQISKMKFDDNNDFALPPDIELSVEDAKRIWG
jgi:hypothetical protein